MISTGGAVGLGALAGLLTNTVQQNRSRQQVAQAMEAQTQRDLADLMAGRSLAALPPATADTYQPRNQVAVMVKGALLTGLTFGFPTFLIAALVQGASTTAGSAVAQGVLVGLMFGLPVAAVTALMPGIIVGLVLQRREIAKRLRAEAQQVLAAYYQRREDLRQRLAAGLTTSSQAVAALCGFTPNYYGLTDNLTPLPEQLATSPPLPEAGRPVTPVELMTLASAVADSTSGYIRIDQGASSTPAGVLRLLQHSDAPERSRVTIRQHNRDEGMDAFAWTMRAYDENDPYRQRVGAHAVKPLLYPHDQEAVTLVASAIGGFRRARAAGAA